MPAKVAVLIPARFASTRFPGKPLHLLAGRPLIQHVWERCQRARGIERVIVATDDTRIADAASGFGAEVSMTSPTHPSGTDRCAEAAKKLRGITHVINVQGDEPMVDPRLISRLAQTLSKKPEIEMITAAHPFAPGEDTTNPNVVKVVCDRHGDALYFSRSVIPHLRGDGRSVAFLRHMGIYGFRADFLQRFVRWKCGALEQAEQLEQLRALENGAKIRVLLTTATSLGVDTPADAQLADTLLRNAK